MKRQKKTETKYVIIYYSAFPLRSPPCYYLSLAMNLSKKTTVIALATKENNNSSNTLHNINKKLFSLLNLCAIKNFYFWELNSRVSRYSFFLKLKLFRLARYRIVLIKNFSEKTKLDKSIPYDLYLFDCTDHFYPDEFKNNSAEIEKFDAVFVNYRLMFNLLKTFNRKTFAVPTGYLRYTSNEQSAKKIPNSIVFSGGISRRIDFNILERCIKKLQQFKFYFIGEIYLDKYYLDHDNNDKLLYKKWRKILKYPNTHYLGHFSVEETQEKLKQFEIGIIPYNTKDFMNMYSNPMKMYEYLMNGLPVVSTPIHAVRENAGKYPVFIFSSPQQFVRKINASRKTKKKIDIHTLFKDNYLNNKSEWIHKFLEGYKYDRHAAYIP